jgi:hypothetical protein
MAITEAFLPVSKAKIESDEVIVTLIPLTHGRDPDGDGQ